MKKGRREFDRQWPGRSTLEDNWRRSSRQNAGFGEEIADVGSYEEALTDDEVRKMLKGVPTTAEDQKVAEDKIMTAMFELGTLYRDRLVKNEKAAITLEKLVRRFPDSRHEKDAFYYLYLAYSDLGNAAKK